MGKFPRYDLISLQEGQIYKEKAEYDKVEHKFHVIKKPTRLLPLWQRTGEIYTGTPKSSFTDKRRQKLFVDVNARTIIDFPLSSELDTRYRIQVEELSEKRIYEALRSRDIPLRYVVICLLGGIGLYALLRLAAAIFGVYVL